MSIIETMIDIPMEHERNVCGQFDAYLKKIERTLHVTMITRDGALKIIGPEQTIRQAKSVFNNLLELSKRGNTITEQNVDYALSLSFTEKDEQILEIDKDIICRTITGKPVKPKTMGQKQYVDLIRKKMIVFGIGPAGTGKTYLAMSMAIQAFKSGEVSRIILTRPAIEAGEKLGFLPGDLQSKIDPYLRPLYDAEEILGTLSGPYDFIFMDAAKGQYMHWLPQILRLLPSGGVLLSDNVLQDGDIVESRYAVERRNRTIHTRMRDYLYELTHMKEFETSVIPIGDGVALSVKR